MKQRESLRGLRRGIFVKKDIKAGEILTTEDVYFAFPPQDNQFTANDWSKYAVFTLTEDVSTNGAIIFDNTVKHDTRDRLLRIAQQVRQIIQDSNIVIPGGVELEISHHYGLDKFDETGLTLLTVVNRGYCKKLLVLLPGQKHPEQYHEKKEETFNILFGEANLYLDGVHRLCKVGDVVHIEPGVRHAFKSPKGCVIEEISSTHFKDDSYYSDLSIMNNKNQRPY